MGSGAQVLGPIKVGAKARIGANAVVLKDVPVGATMVGIPAKIVMGQKKQNIGDFTPYGTPTEDLPDPIFQSFENLRSQLNTLAGRVQELEDELKRVNAGDNEKNNNIVTPGSSSGT